MSALRTASTHPDNNEYSGPAAPTEHHVVKRFLVALLAATCSFGAYGQNAAPTVAMTAPAASANFIAPATITLSADAADSDGTVTSVAFYNGSTLVGTATTAPFSIAWANVALGNYSISARATDDMNATTTSVAVAVAVTSAPVPSVSITAPDGNASFIAPATLVFTAAAAVTGDTISKVEYISGVNVIGTATAPPYTVTLNNIVAGNYAVTAKATGSLGGTATSGSVAVIVSANVAPTVSMTISAATAAAPAAVTLTAVPADSDGTIAKVEFYNGATLLATVDQAPYSYAWSGVTAGGYELSAKAFDNFGLSSVSDTTSLTVTPPPLEGTSQVFYIYSDQINTAREITDASGVKVWQADPDPFGANLPNENPAGQGKFTFNQRFPGQYFDRETGLHYNYYRDYDPQTGRYVQSDPIGLNGGINTYGYVGGNPLSSVDPMGLLSAADLPPLPQGLVDYATGYRSYYGGLVNFASHFARRSGLAGDCEQERAKEEETAMGAAMGAMSDPRIAKEVTERVGNWASENRTHIAGRLSAGIVTGMVVREPRISIGLTTAATMGDALEAVRNGADNAESILKGGLGEEYAGLVKNRRTKCGCEKK